MLSSGAPKDMWQFRSYCLDIIKQYLQEEGKIETGEIERMTEREKALYFDARKELSTFNKAIRFFLEKMSHIGKDSEQFNQKKQEKEKEYEMAKNEFQKVLESVPDKFSRKYNRNHPDFTMSVNRSGEVRSAGAITSLIFEETEGSDGNYQLEELEIFSKIMTAKKEVLLKKEELLLLGEFDEEGLKYVKIFEAILPLFTKLEKETA